LVEHYKVTYCLNGWTWLWRQLLTSMITLKQKCGPDIIQNTIVFYGPPRFKEHIEWLKPRCDLRLKDEMPLHDEESLKRRKIFKTKFWGPMMKIHAYRLPYPEIAWIDADTIIRGDLEEIYSVGRREDYDIMISEWQGHTPGGWYTLAEDEGLVAGTLKMPGFTVFRNNAHNKLLKYYIPFLNRIFEGDLVPPVLNRLEIYAYNLTLLRLQEDGLRVHAMPPDWHQYAGGRYVQHLARKEIATWMEDRLFNPDLHRLKMRGEPEHDW